MPILTQVQVIIYRLLAHVMIFLFLICTAVGVPLGWEAAYAIGGLLTTFMAIVALSYETSQLISSFKMMRAALEEAAKGK